MTNTTNKRSNQNKCSHKQEQFGKNKVCLFLNVRLSSMVYFATVLRDRSNIHDSVHYAMAAVLSHNASPRVNRGLVQCQFQILSATELTNEMIEYSRGSDLPLSGSLFLFNNQLYLLIECNDNNHRDCQNWFEDNCCNWRPIHFERFSAQSKLIASGSFAHLKRIAGSLKIFHSSVIFIPKPVRQQSQQLVY